MSSCPECPGILVEKEGRYVHKDVPNFALTNSKWQECPDCGEQVFGSEMAQAIMDLCWVRKDAETKVKLAGRVLDLEDERSRLASKAENTEEVERCICELGVELARLTAAFSSPEERSAFIKAHKEKKNDVE